MEDQGSSGDRNAGFGSADGQWHHIAVSWESSSGVATLYVDGRKVTPAAWIIPTCVLSIHIPMVYVFNTCRCVA